MKKLLLIVLSLISLNLYSQSTSDGYSWTNGMSFGIYQDGKLAILKDNYGNTPFTTDLIFTVNLEGKQFSTYYFSIQPFYEHANLSGGYLRRYGVNALWNFNRLVIDKLELNIGGGIGMLHRPTGGTYSYGFIGEVRYPILKRLKAGARYELVRRGDVEIFRSNLSFGLIFK